MNSNMYPMPTPTPSPMPVQSPVVDVAVNVNSNRNNKLMNALGYGPNMNVRQNIIAGANPKSYWNHSPGYERPDVREEGPWPVQGNIGSLMTEEAVNNYKSCSPLVDNKVIPDINSSPNCSGTFRPDLYTKVNTCGAECQMKYPESYGDKDFGYPTNMPWYLKNTNAHQVHAYMNIRAGMPGQGPESKLGCYEWVPRVSADEATNSCILNEEPAYQQVGAWNKLKEYKGLEKVYYR